MTRRDPDAEITLRIGYQNLVERLVQAVDESSSACVALRLVAQHLERGEDVLDAIGTVERLRDLLQAAITEGGGDTIREASRAPGFATTR